MSDEHETKDDEQWLKVTKREKRQARKKLASQNKHAASDSAVLDDTSQSHPSSSGVASAIGDLPSEASVVESGPGEISPAVEAGLIHFVPTPRKWELLAPFLTKWDNDVDPVMQITAAADFAEEHGEIEISELLKQSLKGNAAMLNPPIQVGDRPVLLSVTLYFTGEVTDMGAGWVKLTNASWVHWTGRLSELCLRKGFMNHPERQPRTEFVGDVIVATAPLIAVFPGPFDLPTTSLAD